MNAPLARIDGRTVHLGGEVTQHLRTIARELGIARTSKLKRGELIAAILPTRRHAMRVGFTGTQHGMTKPQLLAVTRIFNLWYNRTKEGLVVHHGDCIGADAEFHGIAIQHAAIELHPCTIESKRAHCQGADFEHPALPPLDRNGRIVEACEILLAAPSSGIEERRSGTWSTVRRARNARKPVVVVDPDGTVHAPEGVVL